MNGECPICFEEISVKDIEGLICFTCNTFFCKKCCLTKYFIENNQCPVCRQNLKLTKDAELFSLISLTLEKSPSDYLHLGLVYYKIAETYFNHNLEYSISFFLKSYELGVEIPYQKIANKFFEKKEYQNALLWYQQCQNNILSATQIARIYSILKNNDLAIKWFKISAYLGNYKSISAIGCIYYKLEEYQKAKYWFELGKSLRDTSSINNLAVYYKNIESNYIMFKNLLKPLENSDPLAMYNLSLEYIRLKNFSKAKRLLKNSAKLNYPDAIELIKKNNNLFN